MELTCPFQLLVAPISLLSISAISVGICCIGRDEGREEVSLRALAWRRTRLAQRRKERRTAIWKSGKGGMSQLVCEG